jgi:DNA mismatch repair protein MutL
MSLFVPRVPPPAAGTDPAPEPLHAAPTPMWQLHNTYIVAQTRTGIVLVDQHSAHERVLYEQLMRDFDRGAAATQRLLFPLTLRLSAAECATVEELQGVLERGGWEVEPFGGDHVIVHAAPQPHPGFDAERCLREMIGELTAGSALVDPARTQHQRVALSYACKAAIKAGQPLSRGEMTELFDRLFATELPYHDIHGRPTVVQLSLAELHRRFGRG